MRKSPLKKVGKRGKRFRLADEVFAKFIKDRTNLTCERCGLSAESYGELHCSHRINRDDQTLRWEPDNADCLCPECHRFFEDNTNAYWEWIEEQTNGRITREGMTLRAQTDATPTPQEAIEWLRGLSW